MALGILAALHARQHTGEGQKLVVSMQEAVLGFMVSSMHRFFTGNKVGGQPMKVADGYFTMRMADLSDANWAKLARLIDQDESHYRRAFCNGRGAPPESCRAGGNHSGLGATKNSPGDLARTPRPRYFGAPVLSLGEVMEDLHIKTRKAFIQRDHPSAGATALLAPWIHLSKTPATIHDDAPAIGQHTDEVLGKLLGCEPGAAKRSAPARCRKVTRATREIAAKEG